MESVTNDFIKRRRNVLSLQSIRTQQLRYSRARDNERNVDVHSRDENVAAWFLEEIGAFSWSVTNHSVL